MILKVRGVEKMQFVGQKLYQNRCKKEPRKKLPKHWFFNDFGARFGRQIGPPNGCKTKPVPRRYGNCQEIIASHSEPAFVKRPNG